MTPLLSQYLFFFQKSQSFTSHLQYSLYNGYVAILQLFWGRKTFLTWKETQSPWRDLTTAIKNNLNPTHINTKTYVDRVNTIMNFYHYYVWWRQWKMGNINFIQIYCFFFPDNQYTMIVLSLEIKWEERHFIDYDCRISLYLKHYRRQISWSNVCTLLFELSIQNFNFIAAEFLPSNLPVKSILTSLTN